MFSSLSRDLFLATALYDAIDDGNIRQVTVLLQERAASPNVLIPEYGVTPFHLAVGCNNESFGKEVTKLILKSGGDPNVKAEDGITPLHVAAAWNHDAIIRLLLSYGADPWMLDERDKNSFHYAYEERAWESLKTLNIYRRMEVDGDVQRSSGCKFYLEKVILHTDDVQAEYKTVPRETVIADSDTKTVGTQTSFSLSIIDCKQRKTSAEIADPSDAYRCIYETDLPIQDEYDWLAGGGNDALNSDTLNKIKTHRRGTLYEYIPRISSTSQNDVSLNFAKDNSSSIDFWLNKANFSGSEYGTTENKCSEPGRGKEQIRESEFNDAHEFRPHIQTDKDNEVTELENDSQMVERDRKDSVEEPLGNYCVPDEGDESIDKLQESLFPADKISTDSVIDDEALKKWEERVDDSDNCTYILESGKRNCHSEVFSDREADFLTEEESFYKNQRNTNYSDLLTEDDMPNQVDVSETQNHGNLFENNKKSSISVIQEENEQLLISSQSAFMAQKLSRISDVSTQTGDVENPEVSNCMDGREINEAITSLHQDETFEVDEEYKYTDEDEAIVLLEKRLSVGNVKHRKKLEIATEVQKDIEKRETSDTSAYDTDNLKRELKYRGFEPGPITLTTKRLYLRKLKRIKKESVTEKIILQQPEIAFSAELERILNQNGSSWRQTLSKWSCLENEMVAEFSKKCGLRTVLTKTSFTYLLLDPRVTQNLPKRYEQMNPEEVWYTFLRAIFYIGKGKSQRPYAHLYEAFGIWDRGQTPFRTTYNPKVRHILEIWAADLGVVCLHVFQNITPVEALTREAAMIDAVGLARLKNEKLGTYHGSMMSWSKQRKQRLGACLLYRAMMVFLADGERQLKPNNVGRSSMTRG